MSRRKAIALCVALPAAGMLLAVAFFEVFTGECFSDTDGSRYCQDGKFPVEHDWLYDHFWVCLAVVCAVVWFGVWDSRRRQLRRAKASATLKEK